MSSDEESDPMLSESDDDGISIEPSSSEEEAGESEPIMGSSATKRTEDYDDTISDDEDAAENLENNLVQNFEFEPLDVSDSDCNDSSSDEESFPKIYDFQTPFEIEKTEAQKLMDDVRLCHAERGYGGQSSMKNVVDPSSDIIVQVCYRELPTTGKFVRVDTDRTGNSNNQSNDDLDEDEAEVENRDGTMKTYFDSSYNCLVSTGQGLLAGMSLALMLLFSRFKSNDAGFIVFYMEWAENLRLFHHIMQSLLCCDILSILLFRSRLPDDDYVQKWSDTKVRSRWQRTRVCDIWILVALLTLQGTSLLLSGIMGKMDCVMSVWPEESNDAIAWKDWLLEGSNQKVFDTWKEAAWTRAVFLLVGWLLFNVLIESQRYMDEKILHKWLHLKSEIKRAGVEGTGSMVGAAAKGILKGVALGAAVPFDQDPTGGDRNTLRKRVTMK
eukprot:g844.t1